MIKEQEMFFEGITTHAMNQQAGLLQEAITNELLDAVVWEESCTYCHQVHESDELEWIGNEKLCPSCMTTGRIHLMLSTSMGGDRP